MADVELKPLPPQEAIDYFRAKGLAKSFAWQDVWQEEHARAFTVAKAMDREVLEDIRAEVDKALVDGTTLQQFRQNLTPVLQAKGWWEKQEVVDPATGEKRLSQLGSNRRLRTIYETNLRTAYQAGRWERMQAAKAALPFLTYHHTPGEKNPRPEHEAWDGVTLPMDDPWWRTHYTPNGWGCNCWATQSSQRMLDKAGLKVTEKPPAFPMRSYTNPRTGEVSRIEQGIDPGWAYNVGEARLEGIMPKPSPLRTPPAPDPGARSPPPMPAVHGPQLLAEDVDAREAEASFLGVCGLAPGESRAGVDLGGEPLPLGPGLFRGSDGRPSIFTPAHLRQLPLVAEALMRPHEIRWIWRQGEAGSKPLLMRRYLARQLSAGVAVDVAVDMAAGGSAPSWAFSTSLDPGFDLGALRGGILAWRSPAAPSAK